MVDVCVDSEQTSEDRLGCGHKGRRKANTWGQRKRPRLGPCRTWLLLDHQVETLTDLLREVPLVVQN
jgi:hypothetical protein